MEMNDHSHNEIIIVRRSRDNHDEHHGGVWKIAFADFMTAMMAFFLVMWLINASNEETKKGVASYFNPIKLTDRISNPKGLRNPKYGTPAKTEEKIEEENTLISTPSSMAPMNYDDANMDTTKYDEKTLFTDPYALLSEIVSGIDQQKDSPSKISLSDTTNNVGMGLSGGVAFQDPFDPKAWNLKFGIPQNEGGKRDSSAEEQSIGKRNHPNSVANNADEISDQASQPQPNDPTTSKATALDDTTIKTGTSNIADKLREKIIDIVKSSGKAAPKVEITSDGNGALITLSDRSKSGMFNVGSARPTAEFVRIMAGVGKTLSEMAGQVTISGHTDGRKYQSGDYDNWRLSTARAHMAYHMLVRGGLKEARVEKIEGHAARKLAAPSQPYAATNRRIEIFLRIP